MQLCKKRYSFPQRSVFMRLFHTLLKLHGQYQWMSIVVTTHGALLRVVVNCSFIQQTLELLVSLMFGAMLFNIQGMNAVRKNRYVILPSDFDKSYKKNVKKNDEEFDFYK